MTRLELTSKLLELESLESIYLRRLTPCQLKIHLKERKEKFYKDIKCQVTDKDTLDIYSKLQALSNLICNAMN